MKKFKLKISNTLLVLLLAVALLSLGGAIWNIYNIFAVQNATVGNIISYLIITLLTLVIFCLAISILLFGKYTVTEKFLTIHFGFITTKSKISDIVAITHFKKSDKLVVYFADAKYSVVIIDKNLYDEFVFAVRDFNNKVLFNSQIDGEDTPN